MSKPTYLSWVACNTVWNRLKPSEQEIIRGFHTLRTDPNDKEKSLNRQMKMLASNQRVTVEYVWMVVNKSWQLWAIERGIADE